MARAGLRPVVSVNPFDGLYLAERVVGRPDGFRNEAYDITVDVMP